MHPDSVFGNHLKVASGSGFFTGSNPDFQEKYLGGDGWIYRSSSTIRGPDPDLNFEKTWDTDPSFLRFRTFIIWIRSRI